MANPHSLPKIRQIISEVGAFCPAIMTPKAFLDNSQLEMAHV
jgi:hypothetical protein